MMPRRPCAIEPHVPVVLRHDAEDAHAVGVRLAAPRGRRASCALALMTAIATSCPRAAQLLDGRIVEPEVFGRVPDEQDLHDAVTRPPDSAGARSGALTTSSGTREAPPSCAKTCCATCRWCTLKERLRIERQRGHAAERREIGIAAVGADERARARDHRRLNRQVSFGRHVRGDGGHAPARRFERRDGRRRRTACSGARPAPAG